LDLRPTADCLRETLFNILTAGNPAALEGTVWLDLYAGTGSVGIEALSRGAGKVYFVESSARASALIQNNLLALGVKTGFEIMKQEVAHTLPKLQSLGGAAGFIFLDPPYRMEEEYRRTLRNLGGSRLIGAGSLVIAEHDKRFDPGEQFGWLRRSRKLVQGDAGLSFYRLETHDLRFPLRHPETGPLPRIPDGLPLRSPQG
jgi:16S rRNA (guanine(966)-N(2))-methyltransferase RsmD